MLRAALLALVFASTPHAQPADSTAWITPGGWDADRRESMRDQLVQSAEALGLVPLSDVALTPGSTEIRLWTLRSMFVPYSLVRLTENGGSATGEMRNWWSAPPPDSAAGERPGETFHDGMVDWLRGQCDGFRRVDEIGSCEVRFDRDPDWAALVANATSLTNAVFATPQTERLGCPPGSICLDHSATYTFEVRRGARHRAFSFRASEAEDGRDGPPPAQVAAADSAFSLVTRALLQSMRAPDGERRYRGIFTRSRDGKSLFVACGSQEAWTVSESYPTPLYDIAVGDSVLVDGIGYLRPRWLSAQRGEPRPSFWFKSVSVAEPWDGQPCEGP